MRSLPADDPLAKRVQRVAQDLLPHAQKWNPRAKDWKWDITVIKTPAINALCMPGGKIAVFTGILDALKLTDDELAVVLGHEMAHALREHARARTAKVTLTNVGTLAIGLVIGGNVDGGFVETSGKDRFRIGAAPDVSATHGRGGTWLIDPGDIIITNIAANVNIGGLNPWSSTSHDARLRHPASHECVGHSRGCDHLYRHQWNSRRQYHLSLNPCLRRREQSDSDSCRHQPYLHQCPSHVIRKRFELNSQRQYELGGGDRVGNW